MDLIIAIDQGTTSTKVHLINQKAEIIYTARKSISLITPKDGWVEQDPDEILNSVIFCIKDVYHKALKLNCSILTIGLTNQRETTLIWHKKTGKVIYNAISWQDSRTGNELKSLTKKEQDYITKITGLVPSPYFSASKIKWLITHTLKHKNLENYALGTIDSFIIYHLTGKKTHATDTSNASRTMLFDLRKLDFDAKLLKMFHVKHCMLPQVKNSMDHYGTLCPSILGEELPISSVIGDQQAATIGHCCFNEADAKATFGTGCFIMVNTGKKIHKSEAKLLTTILYSKKNEVFYAIEGSVFYAGSALNWAKDKLELCSDFAHAEKEMAQLEDNGGVYLVPALSGLGAPYWQDKARGVIIGLSHNTSKAHLLRATFEAIAYQTHDLCAALKKEGFDLDSLNIDGGIASNNWFNQFLCEILAKEVYKPYNLELTSMGAAYLAGLQTGFFKSFAELRKLHKIEQKYTHNKISEKTRKKYISSWKTAISFAIKA